MKFVKVGTTVVKAVAILFAICACYCQAAAQTAWDHEAEAIIAYPKMDSLITKKKMDKDMLLMQVQWMDTIFQLERRQGGFITDVPVPKGSNSYYEIYREGPWDGAGFVVPHANCHSFGLDQSFRYAGIDAQAWFSPTTYVDPSALEVLLQTAYSKDNVLDATAMKDLKQAIAPGSLLIFRDSTGVAIHTAFQAEEGILSKNGRYEPRIYHKLEHLKMVYYTAITIEIYSMDADRVKSYLSEEALQAYLKQ